MCGISGALATQRGPDLERFVSRIAESQTCRGPDARVVRHFVNPAFELVLGHNRLSIIDLRPEANQPMASAGGRLHVVFNGEIYNFLELRAELESAGHHFATRSDTEVILTAYEAWGDAAFDRFIGMFSLAIYDAAEQSVLLVRDRFGVKPLYYWTDGTIFAFASTPRVIAQHAGLKPNLDYVARGIRFKYYEDDSDICQYDGMQALEPSHALRVTTHEGRVKTAKFRYYDVAQRAEELAPTLANASEADLEARLLELLRHATALRQRSDVPLGLSVSGGVDSSAVAAILSERLPRVIGYSFARPDRPESEGPLVSELAAATHLEPHWVWVDERREVADLFWKTLHAQDAPFPHASIMAQHAVFRAARADGTIVLLGGQGGDEAFMGYRKFFLFYTQSVLRQQRVAAMPHLLSTLVPLLPPVAKRAGIFLSERRRYSSAAEGMGSRVQFPPSPAGSGMGMTSAQSPRDRQVLDVTRFSIPTLLRYEDRNSMGNSIESRLPFMDHRLVEFGLALPERAKLGRGFGKLILRRALKGLVPDRIRLNRDKRGFDVNQRAWIESGLGDELRSALRDRLGAISDFLPSGTTVDSAFSNAALVSDPQAFKEAVSLVWLGDRL